MGKKAKKKQEARDAPPPPPTEAPTLLEIRSTYDFEKDVLGAEIPAIVDFWAPWCAPCRAMAPAFEAVAEKFKGKVLFAKVNTQASPQLAQAFKVRSIPTMIVFLDGELYDVRVGGAQPDKIEQMVQRVLDKHEGVGMVGKLKRLFKGGEAQGA